MFMKRIIESSVLLLLAASLPVWGAAPDQPAATNAAAGVMGKMISLQSIAVVLAATGMPASDESKLFRWTLRHSVLLTAAIGIIAMVYAHLLPGVIP